MPKYVKVERSDMAGGYTENPKHLPSTIEGELDDIDFLSPGTQIILTVVEMSEEEFEALPEFDGW